MYLNEPATPSMKAWAFSVIGFLSAIVVFGSIQLGSIHKRIGDDGARGFPIHKTVIVDDK